MALTSHYGQGKKRLRAGRTLFLTGLAALICAAAASAQSPGVSLPVPVNSNAEAGEPTADTFPQLATDRAGTWMAVWVSRGSGQGTGAAGTIACAVSLDRGLSWEPRQSVASSGIRDEVDNALPSLATDGEGTWMAVWRRTEGGRSAVFASRSLTNGESWSIPAQISDEGPDTFRGGFAYILSTHTAAGGGGVWTAAWDQGGAVYVCRSTDNGASWPRPVPLITTNRELPDNMQVRLATDGADNWIVVWSHYGTLNGSFDDRIIAQSYSTDGSATWAAPRALSRPNTDPFGGGTTRSDQNPRVATDGRGRWTIAWTRSDCCGEEVGKPYYAQVLTDNLEIAEPESLLHPYFQPSEVGGRPGGVIADGFGNWVIVLNSEDTLGGLLHAATNVLGMVSRDHGRNWTVPRPLNLAALEPDTGSVFPPRDSNADAAADGRGNWVAIWHSTHSLNDRLQFGQNILAASTTQTGGVRGVVISADTREPVACAAVRAVSRNDDIDVERIVTTGKNGRYAIPNLPEGDYLLEVYPTGHLAASAPVTIVAGRTAFQGFLAQPRPFRAGIRGVVVDAANELPVVGARVRLVRNLQVVRTTYTCGAGRYEFADPLGGKQGSAVRFTLEFSSPNYDLDERTVDLEPGQTAETNTQLTKAVGPGALTGVVLEVGTNAPIEGARITVLGKANIATETGPSGGYGLGALLPGQYVVEASAAGFDSASAPKAVPSLTPVIQNFTLKREPVGGPADINDDGVVNAQDVQLVINAALGLPVEPGTDPDVNEDGAVNAMDIQLVINAALGIVLE